jgi:hypothetical protein
VGLALGAAVILLSVRVWWSRRTWELFLLTLLGSGQAAVFVLALAETPLPFPVRPLLVCIIGLYLGVAVVTAALFQMRPRARSVLALGVAFFVIALAIEVLSTILLQESPQHGTVASGGIAEGVRYRGSTQEHPTLGMIPAPGSVSETIYPDDPRGYFGSRRGAWSLSLQPSSDAELVPGDGEVAVAIARADDHTRWHVQLALQGLALEAGERYTLSFRTRATREREYAVGVGMAHAPWEGLGLYHTATVRSEWTRVERAFTARLSDDNARVIFDMGGDTADVHVADVAVKRSDGTLVVGSAPEYFVETAWNSRGCRGPEYTVPRGPGTYRILALGGSYTEGVGVHAEDTFTALMQDRLQRRASQARQPMLFEVLNCGVRGLSTREQRLHYEEGLRAYEPDLVLVVLSVDESRAFSDASGIGHGREPARWEHLLHSLRLVELIRQRRTAGPSASAVAELARLHEVVRRDGAELGVVLFNRPADRDWMTWVERAESVASSLDVHLLDLTDLLAAHDWSAELAVHPIDEHPNQRAHEIVAEATIEWLEREGLLGVP